MPETNGIKVFYNDMEQISSGTIIFGTQDKIKFEIEKDIFIVFEFCVDDQEKKNYIQRKIEKNYLILKLYNFTSLGTSYVGPIEIGQIGNRLYMICFTVFNIGDDKSTIRTLHYNWYKKEVLKNG